MTEPALAAGAAQGPASRAESCSPCQCILQSSSSCLQWFGCVLGPGLVIGMEYMESNEILYGTRNGVVFIAGWS